MSRKTTDVRQSEIIDTAMRIIAEQGSRRFTAQLLADEIGVTPGAIFRHFDSMDAIADAMVKRMEQLLFADFPPVADDPIERLGLFFQRRVRTIMEYPIISRLLLTDHLAHVGSGLGVEKIAEFKARSRNFVREALKEAHKRGLLLGVAGVEDGAVLVLGAILAIGHTGAGGSDRSGIEGIGARVWTTLEAALRGKGQVKKKSTRKGESHGKC